MKTPKTAPLAGILICLLLAACDPSGQRRLDRETLEREMRTREPRRIKEAEILEAGREIGQAITARLNQNRLLEETGCCPTVPPQVLDSLELAYKVSITCHGLEGSLPKTTDTLEQQLLEAYQYNLEQEQPLQISIQPSGQQEFIFTAPATNGGTTKTSCGVWSIRLSRKQVVLSM